MVMIDGRQYLTPAEAALVLNVSVGHVRWLLRRGRIEGWRDRRRLWALADSVRRYGVPGAVVVQGRKVVAG
jgi:excisionase family DNA binding protein